MENGILVINAGSSSIKFAVFVEGERSAPVLKFKGQLQGIGSDPEFAVKGPSGESVDAHDEWARGSTLTHLGAILFILDWLKERASDVEIVGAGHRVVHGGLAYDRAVRIENSVIAELKELQALAPLHQPHNIAAIEALAEANPSLPQVACFDTAFHSTQPRVAQMFALPRQLFDLGIRRYGFHGLSYEFITRQLPRFAKDARRAVIAHLGSGASMCAVRDGKSVESTMGFTAVDGLPMGTRTGALDPGVILHLIQARGFDANAVEQLLYKQSGLLGVSGISNDMRDLEASDDPHAAEAIDLFVYHIAKALGALSAAMQGIDALVFTAGIGENSSHIRRRVCESGAWLGLSLDLAANEAGGPRISSAESAVSAWVIPTDEERMIASHTLELVAGKAGTKAVLP